eukprot:snap_masked-scaffold_28-processed-gene-1.6-mRNA-1 protein AED:1.00 eAED:1.00 QI:0/0/0/0/1/1/2/0/762
MSEPASGHSHSKNSVSELILYPKNYSELDSKLNSSQNHPQPLVNTSLDTGISLSKEVPIEIIPARKRIILLRKRVFDCLVFFKNALRKETIQTLWKQDFWIENWITPKIKKKPDIKNSESNLLTYDILMTVKCAFEDFKKLFLQFSVSSENLDKMFDEVFETHEKYNSELNPVYVNTLLNNAPVELQKEENKYLLKLEKEKISSLVFATSDSISLRKSTSKRKLSEYLLSDISKKREIVEKLDPLNMPRIGTRKQLVSLGRGVPIAGKGWEKYNTNKFMYPVGYKSISVFWCYKNPDEKVEYLNEILAGEDGPMFKLTHTLSGKYWIATTPSKAWMDMAIELNSTRAELGQQQGNTNFWGAHEFGLDGFKKFIEGCLGSECCENYIFENQKEIGEIKMKSFSSTYNPNLDLFNEKNYVKSKLGELRRKFDIYLDIDLRRRDKLVRKNLGRYDENGSRNKFRRTDFGRVSEETFEGFTSKFKSYAAITQRKIHTVFPKNDFSSDIFSRIISSFTFLSKQLKGKNISFNLLLSKSFNEKLTRLKSTRRTVQESNNVFILGEDETLLSYKIGSQISAIFYSELADVSIAAFENPFPDIPVFSVVLRVHRKVLCAATIGLFGVNDLKHETDWIFGDIASLATRNEFKKKGLGSLVVNFLRLMGQQISSANYNFAYLARASASSQVFWTSKVEGFISGLRDLIKMPEQRVPEKTREVCQEVMMDSKRLNFFFKHKELSVLWVKEFDKLEEAHKCFAKSLKRSEYIKM